MRRLGWIEALVAWRISGLLTEPLSLRFEMTGRVELLDGAGRHRGLPLRILVSFYEYVPWAVGGS